VKLDKEWLSIQEAADYLGVARPTIYRWAKESKIRIFKLSEGVARVRREDLEAFLRNARCCTQIRRSMLISHARARSTQKQSLAADPILDVIGSLSGERSQLRRSKRDCTAKERGARAWRLDLSS